MGFGATQPKEYQQYWKSTTAGLGSTGLVVSAVAASLAFAGISTSLATSLGGGFLKIYNKATAATSSDTPVMVLNAKSGWPLGTTATFSAGISIRYCNNSIKGGASNGAAGSVTILYDTV